MDDAASSADEADSSSMETDDETSDLESSDPTTGSSNSEDSSSETSESADDSTNSTDPTSNELDGLKPVADPFFVVGSGSDNLSGLTYHPGRDLYYGVVDNDGPIYEISHDVQTVLRTIVREGSLRDFEGIAYVQGDQFALVSESNTMAIVEIGPDTAMVDTSVTEWNFHGPSEPNLGAEGVAFAPDTGPNGQFWVALEKSPRKILRFDRPIDLQSHDLDELNVQEPWDAEALPIRDLADLVYVPQNGHLIICGQEDGQLIEVNMDGGEVLATLDLSSTFGDAKAKWEGVTVGRNGEVVVVSEGLGAMYNWAQRWSK
jgi:uncharacterized protein YjiK